MCISSCEVNQYYDCVTTIVSYKRMNPFNILSSTFSFLILQCKNTLIQLTKYDIMTLFQIVGVKESHPNVAVIDVNSASSHKALRLYAVAVLHYTNRQIALIKALF